ncbi:hypothetical protein GCM10027418_17630 [Mariniluteicoccus endophyticus]
MSTHDHDHPHHHHDHDGQKSLTDADMLAQQERDHQASFAAPTHWPDAAEMGSTLRFIPDTEQRNDHSGVPITPMTEAGMPYRYKVRHTDTALPGNWYASTVHEVLALLIDGYPPLAPANAEQELATVDARADFARGVVVQYVVNAMMNRVLGDDEAAEKWLQRSASFGQDQPVLSNRELAAWNHPAVPLLLIAELYDDTTAPPAGEKHWLHISDETQFLHDLARIGVLQLEENPYYTATAPMEVRVGAAQPQE